MAEAGPGQISTACPPLPHSATHRFWGQKPRVPILRKKLQQMSAAWLRWPQSEPGLVLHALRRVHPLTPETRYSIVLIPRHFGKAVHPQKAPPAFAPCFAMRFSILPPHRGQVGAAAGVVVCADVCTLAGTRPADTAISGRAARTRSIMALSAGPSMSSMFFPATNEHASALKVPEVTTNPPVAPCDAITPNNSRTTLTETL